MDKLNAKSVFGIESLKLALKLEITVNLGAKVLH